MTSIPYQLHIGVRGFGGVERGGISLTFTDPNLQSPSKMISALVEADRVRSASLKRITMIVASIYVTAFGSTEEERRQFLEIITNPSQVSPMDMVEALVILLKNTSGFNRTEMFPPFVHWIMEGYISHGQEKAGQEFFETMWQRLNGSSERDEIPLHIKEGIQAALEPHVMIEETINKQRIWYVPGKGHIPRQPKLPGL